MTETTTTLLILAIGVAATEPWRWLGVFASEGLDEQSEIIKWVRAVSTALIAALVARLIVASPGELADIALVDKIIAMVVSLLIYLYQANLLTAIAGGSAAILLLSII